MNKYVIRAMVFFLLAGYGLAIIMVFTNYVGYLPSLQEEQPIIAFLIGMLCFLAALSTFGIWGSMIYHCGINEFTDRSYKRNWLLAMMFGMFAGALVYYYFVFELGKGLKSKDKTTVNNRDNVNCEMRMTTKDASFLTAVSDSLKKIGFVIIHIDYVGGAGAHNYFLVKSEADIKEVLSKIKRRDSVSVFMDEAITIKGEAGDLLQEQALSMLARLQVDDSDESVIAVRRDTDNLMLNYEDDWEQLSLPEEIKQWFDKNQGAFVFVFPPPWNNDKVLEAVGK